MTFPAATVLLAAVVTVPTTRPAPVIAVVAAACVRPTTFGTATCAGPVDTTRFTAEPALTCVPAAGVSLMTFPAATVLLAAVVTMLSTNPAAVMAVSAATCVRLTTLGTVTCTEVPGSKIANGERELTLAHTVFVFTSTEIVRSTHTPDSIWKSRTLC